MWTYLVAAACLICIGESLEILSEGDTIELNPSSTTSTTLQCAIQWDDGVESLGTPAHWKKSQGGNAFIDLSTSAQIEVPFQGTGRFSITPVVNGNRWELPLVIADLSAEDAGVYRCGTETKYVEYTLHVLQSLADLEIIGGPNASDESSWDSDTLVYHFVEGGTGYGFFQCIARGGSPPATLHVSVDGEDNQITGHLESGNNETLTGSTPGLQTLTSMSWVQSEYFSLPKEYHGKILRCQASISQGTGEFGGMDREALININYKPVIQCEEGYQMPLDGEHIHIACTLNARPIPHHVSFHSINTGHEIIANGAVNGELNAQANMEVDNNLSDTVTVTLTFINVESTHFQDYTLKARNAVGTSQVNFEVTEGEVEVIDSASCDGPHCGGTSIHTSTGLLIAAIATVLKLL